MKRLFSRRLAVAFAATAGATLAFLAPGTAQAAEAKVTDVVERGAVLSINGGHNEETELWGVQAAGEDTVLKTYCIEHNEQADPGSGRTEKPWSEFPGTKADPGKVLWVLHNSYPKISVDKLAAAIEKDQPEGPIDLDAKEAIAGTQAAIWFFAGDAKIDKQANDDINRVFTYLFSNAKAVSNVKPELTLSPATGEVAAGEQAGPFTVKTNADAATVKLTGAPNAKLVDAQGQPIGDTVKNGDQVFVTTPAQTNGEANIELAAEWTQLDGRLFVSDTKQDLIVPKTEKETLTAKATVKWTYTTPTPTPTETPAPTTTTPAPGNGGQLPQTGSSSVLPIAITGAALLAVGVGVVLVARRRKMNTAA